MWYNRFVLPLLKSPLHFFLSGSILVLRLTGRKSGKQIEVPVNYTIDRVAPLRLLVTSQRDRTWWRNLRGGAQVEILLRGRWRRGHAESVEDQERVMQALHSIFEHKPGSARFYGVEPDERGGWGAGSLAKSAATRVAVQIEIA
jgi:hypothetical protein